MTWDLGSISEFDPQPVLVSSMPTLDEPFASLSAPFPTRPSNGENRQPTESIGDTTSGFNGSPLVLETPGTASGSSQSAKRAPADHPSEESLFLQFNVGSTSNLEGVEESSLSIASLTGSTSSTGATAAKSRHSSEVSSTTSVHSAEGERCHHKANPAKARKLSSTERAQGTFSDSPIPSHQQTLELLEIFFSSYHHFLPCIHRKSFVHRIERGGLIASDPLLQVVLAIAAPAHSSHQVQALRDCWLARAKSLFEKDLSFSTLPTQSLQAAVWIILCAYVAGELTEAWFFLGKACRFAHFLGCDRVDCGRSERLITMSPQTRDAIELEERRKTVWALFLFDRSLSCLAGFSHAIDDRHFYVNFPIDDVQFQDFTHSVSLTEWFASMS